MPGQATPAILHMVGYVTGATLYAMLLVMLVRAHGGVDRLGRATALLGLAWNIGELLAHGARAAGYAAAALWLSAFAYAALGLLAAVVVHSVSRARRDDTDLRRLLARAVAIIAYGSAVGAGLLHLRAAAIGAPLPAPIGLDVMTAGLVALGVPLFIVTRRQDHARRALWMSALAMFAVSALHLSRFHGTNESWIVELLGHHASVPLAFAMLYRDYRFALADLFLKRALTLLALVMLVLFGYMAIGADLDPRNPVAVGLLLAAWMGTAIVFPFLRRVINWFVDRVILSRDDYARLVERLGVSIQQAERVEDVIARACEALAPALTATSVSFADRRPDVPIAPNEVDVPTTDLPRYVLRVGPLAGGRRLLSDDLIMLDRVAVILARRIDAIRLTDERYERVLQDREMRTLATEAELKALRAQVNPHFLFNALTTIGYLIQSAPPRALETLMRLTTLLRAVLRSEGEFTSLGRERELIECYLQIERERFEERLDVTIDIPDRLANVPIPALIVQPLVENAIKHGIAPSLAGGRLSVVADLDRSRSPADLCIVVRNTGAPLVGRDSLDGGGVGLSSVERRLQCYYGAEATLRLRRDGDGATIAELTLPAGDREDIDIAVARQGRDA